MEIYIALFRGINVGGKNILPMKDLSGILESLGCQSVRTYIQSGNVVFRFGKRNRKTLPRRIIQKISEIHGFAPRVLLLSAEELRAAAANTPFPTDVGKTVHLFFLETPPSAPDMERIANLKAASEEFRLHQNVFYLHASDGIGRSKLAAKVEQCLGVPATARNWNTVEKLLEMVGEAAS